MSETPNDQSRMNIEITDDNAVLRMIIREMVNVLNGPQGRPNTRQRSLAVTKLEEAYMWLGEDDRVN
jgi:hypothetical protein